MAAIQNAKASFKKMFIIFSIIRMEVIGYRLVLTYYRTEYRISFQCFFLNLLGRAVETWNFEFV